MISRRLADLGIELPAVAAPVAAYIPAKRTGNEVRTSGQLPFVDGELVARGKVGADVSQAEAYGLARQCALNALAAAAAVVGLDNLGGVSHVTGFVASAPDFTNQPGVINGASDVLGEIFGEAGAHTRSAVGVAVLPLDAPVEVEVTFLVS
ncbi:enamine deaminase RidA (YjgF/YER057c/UK114 family) [Trueperella bonasi]|uniref:Enamine deaminase RidA (YjgF/YER057c/UK114 family) n=1 Tax=Trueperella bonasi TaxID=312286 RepID=A0ABT9NGF6_9ACTO|nr:RidA family protein [Trueperella bonasi]MDP9806265.1 enamine deaminase RidA (YjgF/YER057c/UK114 family) [Trueperella bonasi]